jgi:radical SAM superfamily enzyme YgiQ (UPF0313 family)
MNILLIAPPLPERTYPGKSMGPDYLGGELIRHDYRNVEILDLDVAGKKSLLPTLRQYQPNIVGITNLSIQNDIANEIAKEVKTFDKDIVVVKGGFHELFGYSNTILHHHDYVDYVVVGEGEKIFLELVEAHSEGELIDRRKYMKGLAYAKDGGVHFRGRRDTIPKIELDEMLPARMHHHRSYDFDVLDYKKTAQMMTVRGCADSCNFCMESKTGHTERRRTIGSVYNELRELDREGYKAVYFDDSTFTRDQERVKEICNLFKTHFPNTVWGCNTRDDFLNGGLIKIMKESGCVYMFTGFESAVPEILAAMNKTHNPSYYLENAKRIYALMKESSIRSSVFIIFGSAKEINTHPGDKEYAPETFKDVEYTLDFVLKELRPRYLSMNVLRLLPGAPFSTDEKYKDIRPMGQVIHAGHYDKKWYQTHGMDDIRTRHHIYRAFEGRGSVVPPQMTPDYCYEILRYAIDRVNEFNGCNDWSCKIIMDKAFEDMYVEEKSGKYKIVPFPKISNGIDA